MLSLTFPMISAICTEFESLINDGVYQDIAQSICSTHFATEHNVTMKEAQTLVGCALHMGIDGFTVRVDAHRGKSYV